MVVKNRWAIERNGHVKERGIGQDLRLNFRFSIKDWLI